MTKLFALVALLAVIVGASAFPGYHTFISNFLRSNSAQNGEWKMTSRSPGDRYIPINILLKQRNVDVLEEMFWDRSNPKSSNYGHWLSTEEISHIVEPARDEQEAVMAWLYTNSIHNVINRGDYIRFFAQISTVENLFKTVMYDWMDNTGRRVAVAAEGRYSIPENLAKNIEFVTGLAEFPPLQKRAKVHPENAVQAPKGNTDPGVVVPGIVQDLYNIKKNNPISLGSQGVAEFQGYASFSKSDLSQFLQQTDLPSVQIDNIVGPYQPSFPGVESQLDIQYILASGITFDSNSTWFWTNNGWMLDFANDLFAASQAPHVVSMSWGWTEQDQCKITSCTDSQQYVERVNTEFLKIGLRGITLLASSGDQGAPGDGNPYCNNGELTPLFPSSSPYVLSVGATMLNCDSGRSLQDNSPVCNANTCAKCSNEVACSHPDALITTGGGFSQYTSTPAYQKSVVETYLNSTVPLPPISKFRADGRGAPDVAAVGHNFFVMNSGRFIRVDGTSASAPVFAGVIAQLNEVRLNQGKSVLGFANQLIYQMYEEHPAAFNDVTSGNNKCTEACCSQYGYEAAQGWDPVTGLGTPNVEEMLNYIKNLN